MSAGAKREEALRELAALQGSDGGWGYRERTPSMAEPTALALLALAPATPPDPGTSLKGTAPEARGLKHLMSCQDPAGWMALSVEDGEPSWTTSPGVLALRAHGHGGNALLAERWLAGWTSPATPPSARAVARTRELLGIDMSIPAWPWFGETSGWVEPTAMACLALRGSPAEGAAPRVADALRYLADRRCADGGWNYGNPVAFGKELASQPIPTAKALLARAAEGPDEAGRARLEAHLEDNPSRGAQAWGALALQALGATASARHAAGKALGPPDPRAPLPRGPVELALGVLADRCLDGEGPGVLAPRRTG